MKHFKKIKIDKSQVKTNSEIKQLSRKIQRIHGFWSFKWIGWIDWFFFLLACVIGVIILVIVRFLMHYGIADGFLFGSIAMVVYSGIWLVSRFKFNYKRTYLMRKAMFSVFLGAYNLTRFQLPKKNLARYYENADKFQAHHEEWINKTKYGFYFTSAFSLLVFASCLIAYLIIFNQ